jgi:TrmH family RNA methyltransferase
MEKLAEKEHPQGLLAVVRQKRMTFDDIGRISSAVALVSPQDPGNVGAVLRTLDAVGGEALFLLDGGVELYHPTLVRASMGTLFGNPVVRASLYDFVEWARAGGITLIGTSAHADKEYREVQLTWSRWVLVMGNEQKGLSPEQIAACDVCLAIPMRGRASSLNLAVATGILLYALRK